MSLTPGKSEHGDERSLSKGSRASDNLKMQRHPKVSMSWVKMIFEDTLTGGIERKGSSNIQTPKKMLGMSNSNSNSAAY